MRLHPIREINQNIQNEKNDKRIWYFNEIGIVVLSVLGLGIVFDDVCRFVHHPVECLHIQLGLQLFAHQRSNAGIVFVEPAFLFKNDNYETMNCQRRERWTGLGHIPLEHWASLSRSISVHMALDWRLRILETSFRLYDVFPDPWLPKHSRCVSRIAPFCTKPVLFVSRGILV